MTYTGQSKLGRLEEELSRITRGRREVELGERRLKEMGFDEASANKKVAELNKLQKDLEEWTKEGR